MKMISAFLLACGILAAQSPQAPNPTQQPMATVDVGVVPIYRVTVVARTMKAINYNHRSGSTHIGFRGTALMPQARGDVRVESKQGVIKIDADMQKLTAATQFGPEYLTYVMWAITPEGRATNVGEVLIGGGRSNLHATTELQSFGLIVTAEPYFAVTQPSDVVVMENVVLEGTTVGTVEELEAKYELLPRGQYVLNVNPADVRPIVLDHKVPLELYEARNAVQIARWTGADRYAGDTFQKALDGLTNAEGYLIGKSGSKPIGTVAREAVQMAEDARIITIKKMQAEQLAGERKAGADREARSESARVTAQSETERVGQAAQAQARQHDAEMAATQLEAERVKRNSEFRASAAESEVDRMKRENAALALTNQNEADRLKHDSDIRALAAQSENDRMKLDNANQAASAQTEADRLKREGDARVLAAQSENDRMKLDNANQAASAQTEADRLKREGDARLLAAQSETDRMKSVNSAQAAAAQAQAMAAEAEAARLKRENDADRASSQASLDRAAADKAQSEKDKTALRAQLLEQFNAILQTRDSARGLIVNMSDVLFDTAKYSLRPLAREKLAKVAGIFAGHPGLRLQVEGFTDSVGADDYNQNLSENRAGSVRDYLTEAGIPVAAVTAKGFGKTLPVASNTTAAGRQQNRRVELVVSGDIIGSDIRASTFTVR